MTRARAHRQAHKPGVMNKTEERYAMYLECRKRAGEIASYCFEAVKLRLADNTFYTPDFMVVNAAQEIEMHEVKGFWQDDARVKIKVAAGMFPFLFVAVKETRNGYETESF